MTIHIHPAHVGRLPIILREVVVPPAALAEPEAPCPLTLWCICVGRTAADVTVLLFDQPMPEPLREVFEAEIRRAVTAEALGFSPVDERVQQHLQDVASIVFDRRLERHQWNAVGTGSG